MTLEEIFLGGGGLLAAALTLLQIAPVKISPWSAIAKALGRAFNGEVLQQLAEVRTAQEETRATLNKHIQTDDERAADGHRACILRFNNELIQDLPHTREEFIEILTEIDKYEAYCRAHPEYENNRATHAISNIGRVYDDRLKQHDFA